MKLRTLFIGISLVSSLFIQGCYTQLSIFYPEPEIEQEEGQFFETYSRAPIRPSLDMYAQNEGGMPLGYSMMQNRFNPFYGYMDPYNYGYNPYYYNGYGSGYGNFNLYGYNYNLGGYSMFIPLGDEREMRKFNKDRTQTSGTNLNVYRSSGNTSSSRENNSSYTNSSSVSATRSSGSSSASSSSSSSSSGSSKSNGRRATRRN